MSELLTPQTGDEKMDEAYIKLSAHIECFDTFPAFLDYFAGLTKDVDKLNLNLWLLKVLYVMMKQTPKHPFDRLLESVNDDKREQLKKWLRDNLEKVSKA